MKRFSFILVGIALLALSFSASEAAPLRLIRTIPLPDVQGRIDHMAVDVNGRRLFVAALGNNSLEVLDLKEEKRIHSIKGLSEPQGVGYVPELNRIFVANGGDGTCRLFDGNTFNLVSTANLGDDADNVRSYPGLGLVYVGYGRGGLATVNPTSGHLVGNVKLDAHPEAFEVEKSGSKIYANVPGANEVVVIDGNKQSVTAKWPLKNFRSNFPMALDESHQRLFIGTWRPARLIVLDTTSGKVIAELECSKDADDLFYDPASKLIFMSCGEGSVDVFAQRDPDRYEAVAKIPSASGARTSLFSPEMKLLFVAAPKHDNAEAAIMVYETGP